LEKAVTALPPGFEGLVALVKVLRSDHGCPWDREQTPEQLKTYLLEEAYEVLEALESGTSQDVCAELGDLLFHVVFLARMFEEEGNFSIGDVLEAVTTKMVRRHPHVFGKAQVSSPDGVRHQWHEIKQAETKEKDGNQLSSLDSVPQSLPALMRAYRLGERAARLGLDSPDMERSLKKLDKTLKAFRVSFTRAASGELAELLGDMLFTVSNLARLARVHPEAALRQTLLAFVRQAKGTQNSQ
jgi:MazG family protein